MPLELSQLHSVRQNSIGSVIAGYLPGVVAKHFGCHLGIAYLSRRSLEHILANHKDIQLLDILQMPEMIRSGLWIADKPNSACVIYTPPDRDGMFHYASGLKVTGGGFEPYMSSFYRIGRRQIDAKRRRGIILQEHL